MSRDLDSKLEVIRDGWSEEERENRRDLAGAMQLQLHQLCMLAADDQKPLGASRKAAEVKMASAC